MHAPKLAVPNAHQNVANLERRTRIPWVPALRTPADQIVLGGQRLGRVDEGVHTGGIGIQHRLRLVVERVVIGARRFAKTEPSHEDILLDSHRSGELRPTTIGPMAIVIHLPKPVLSVNEPLDEKRIMRRCRAHMRNAKLISIDVDRFVESVERQRARDVR